MARFARRWQASRSAPGRQPHALSEGGWTDADACGEHWQKVDETQARTHEKPERRRSPPPPALAEERQRQSWAQTKNGGKVIIGKFQPFRVGHPGQKLREKTDDDDQRVPLAPRDEAKQRHENRRLAGVYDHRVGEANDRGGWIGGRPERGAAALDEEKIPDRPPQGRPCVPETHIGMIGGMA